MNQQLKQRIIEYNKNPKRCLYCNTPISYERKYAKFCNSSCSAKYNNSRRIVTDKSKRNYKGYYYISPKDNKRHKYYPDFIIDDTIIEIKGWVNAVSLAKINAVKNDYNLKIMMIDKTDIRKYIEYAILKYGEHFYLDLKD